MWFGQRGLNQQSKPSAVLDVGSHKICCLIGMPQASIAKDGLSEPGSRLKLLGYSCRQSDGIAAGCVINMDAAEMAIRRVIAEAEKMADLIVERIYVTASGDHRGERLTAKVPVPDGVVRKAHIDKAIAAVRRDAAAQRKVALHPHPISFAIGAESGIRDPRGMTGDAMRVDLHAIFVNPQPFANLKLCLQRGHIDLAGFCASGYASAMGVATRKEAAAGVIVIDMGAGATNLVALSGGRMIYADSAKSGGARITADLAEVFALTVSEAERLKTLHGGVMSGPEDEGAPILLPIRANGGDTWLSLRKLEVSSVIRRRQEAIFTLIADRLQITKLDPRPNQIILTGGGSQIMGAAQLAERVFNSPARIAAPPAFFKGPSPAIGPEFAAAAGLLSRIHDDDWTLDLVLPVREHKDGYLARVSEWLWHGF